MQLSTGQTSLQRLQPTHSCSAPISFSFPVRERAVLHYKSKLFVLPHQHHYKSKQLKVSIINRATELAEIAANTFFCFYGVSVVRFAIVQVDGLV
jgi:hypothetical protein